MTKVHKVKIRQGDTEIFHDKISCCEDIEELKEIFDKNSNYYQDWKRFINAVVEIDHLSYESLERLSNCSKNTAK